jgi:hypothetical protein
LTPMRAPLALTRRRQNKQAGNPDHQVDVIDRPTTTFPADPVARIERVAREIAELAEKLEGTGAEARNLRHWSLELTLTCAELKQRYAPKALI